MAAPRASIAVSVTRAGLTLATAFALTRVFAGRSWLFVMVLAAVAAARVPRLGATPPLAPARPARAWWPSPACGSPRSSPIPATTVAGIPSRATLVVARARARHGAAHAPRRGRSGRAHRLGARARVRRRVRRRRADVLDRDLARRAGRRVRAEHRAVHRRRRDRQRRLGRADRALRARGARLPARARAARPRDPAHVVPREPAARRRGSRPAGCSSARSRSRPRSSSARRCRARAAARSSTTARSGAATARASLLSAPPPILSIQDKLTLGPVAGAVHGQGAARRVLAGDRARLVHRRQRVGRQQGHRASRVEAHGPADLPPSTALHQQFHIEQLDPHWLPAAYQPVAINLTAARVVPDSLTLLVDSKAQLQRPRLRRRLRRSRRRRRRPAGAAPFSDPRAMARDLELPTDFSAAGAHARAADHRRTPTRRTSAPPRSRSSSAAARSSTRSTPTSATPPTRSRSSSSRRSAGFCEQFAASFAAMARAVGVPARVAVGYQPGHARRRRPLPRDEPQRARLARGVDRGRGLDPVRADPGLRGADARARHRRAREAAAAPRHRSTTPDDGEHPDRRRSRSRPSRRSSPATRAGADPAAEPRRSHHARAQRARRRSRSRSAPSRSASLAFFAIVSFTLWRRGRRRRARSRSSPARARRVGRSRSTSSASAGVPPRPSATALEFALRYAPAHGAGDAGPALMELARLQSAAMFAREAPSAVEASTSRGSRSTRSAPRSAATSPRSTRWRRRFGVATSDPADQLPSRSAARRTSARSASNARTSASTSAASAVDGDEQRELAGVQRVEDLAVVVARPHAAAVGDDAQAREVVARLAHPAHRRVHAGRRQPGVEERPHDAQRDEIAKRVPAAVGGRRYEPAPRPVAKLRDRATGEPRRLRGGVAHAGLSCRRGGSDRATRDPARRRCRAGRRSRASRP